MSRKMYRFEVPVDDQAHPFELTGDPVRVDSPTTRGPVEFWAEYDSDVNPITRAFRVFGTGQTLPDHAQWIGTCPRTPDGLVWHLYEVHVR